RTRISFAARPPRSSWGGLARNRASRLDRFLADGGRLVHVPFLEEHVVVDQGGDRGTDRGRDVVDPRPWIPLPGGNGGAERDLRVHVGARDRPGDEDVDRDRET